MLTSIFNADSSTHQQSSRFPIEQRTFVWAMTLLYSIGLFRLYIDWNFDDSYIVFRIVQNILNGHGWVYNIGESYNASTSALNTILISLLCKVTGLPVPFVAHLVGAIGIFFVGIALLLLLRSYLSLGIALAASLIVMDTMAANLTWGLETHLFCGGLLILCALEAQCRQTWWLVGFLILLRPDALLLFIFKLAVAIKEKKVPVKGIVTVGLIIFPWAIFSLYNFGQIFPDTLSNKVWQGRSGFWGTGPIYLKGLVIHLLGFKHLWWWVPFIIFGLWQVLKRYRALLYLGLFVCAQQAAYVILNVPAYHWYFSVLDLSLVIAFIIGTSHAIYFLITRAESLFSWIKGEVDISFGLLIGCLIFSILLLFQEKISPDGRDISYEKLSSVINQANISEGSLAALEVGTIGYRVNRKIIDLVSLTSVNPEFLSGKNNDHFFQLLPRIVVVHHPVWPMERAIFEDLRFESLYMLGGIVSETAVPTKFYVLKDLSATEQDQILALGNKRAIQQLKSEESDVASSVSTSIRCNVDVFAYQPVDYTKVTNIKKNQQNEINLDGWIFSSDTNLPLNEVFVLVRSSSGEVLVTSARAYERPDVANAFSMDSVLASGFKARIDISSLHEGDYVISIADKRSDTSYELCERAISFVVLN